MPRPWRRALFPELFMPLIWGLYWWPVISGQAYLYIRDLTLFALPMKSFMIKRLSAGDLPLWTPHAAAGMPFLADPSNQVLYPGNIIFWLLPIPQQALSWFLIGHHLLAMFTFSWLCRTRGLGRWISTWAGIAYALSGYSLSITDNVNFLPALAWAPAALAAYCLGLNRRRYVYAVPGALCLAFIVLAGDPLNAVVLVVLWGVLWMQWVATRHGAGCSMLSALPGFAGRLLLTSLVLALLISAVQILPALDLASVSVRRNGLSYEELSKWSFPVRRLLELLQPFFFASNYPTLDFLAADAYPAMREPWANSVYMGTLSVLLAGVGIATRARRESPWLLLLAVTALLSFGANAGYHLVLVKYLPFFDSQRYPEKFIFWVTLTGSYLAAVGARALLDRGSVWSTPKALQKPLIKTTLSFAGVILALWGLVYLPARLWIWEHAFDVFYVWALRLPWAGSHFHILALHTLIVTAVVIGLFWIPAARRNAWLGTVLLLGVLDLFWVHYRFVPMMPPPLADNAPAPYALQFLDRQEAANPYRIYYDVHTPKSDINYVPGDIQQRVLLALDPRESPFAQGYAHLYAALFRRDRLQVNSAVIQGLNYLNGRMSPLQPALALALENDLLHRDPHKLMALSGVRYVISALTPRNPAWDRDGFVTLHENIARNLRIIENRQWLSGAQVMPKARLGGTSTETELAAIAASPNAGQTLVLAGLEPAPPTRSDSSCKTDRPPPVRITRTRPEHIKLAGTSPCPNAYLLLNETWSAGWTVTLNGLPAKIRPANLRFMAVALPRGPFKAVFRYREPRLLSAALLSGLGLALCLMIGIYSRKHGSQV